MRNVLREGSEGSDSAKKKRRKSEIWVLLSYYFASHLNTINLFEAELIFSTARAGSFICGTIGVHTGKRVIIKFA